MFTSNPFAELSASISPAVMKTYVVVMVVLVVAGTLFDVIHKRSARYFFDDWRQAKSRGSKQVGGGEMASLAVRTLCVEVLTSAEFCTARRRIAHLLTMYGFLAYVVTTAIMIFGYPTPETPAPAILPSLWHLGALMVCVGGYWFWFFIRADVAAEGNSPFRVMHADLFILSLLASVTLGLIWSLLQSGGASWWSNLFFALYVVTTAIMIFSYPTPETPAPAVLPSLWHIGALMVCVGGYWFWFFIRADVAAEGNSPFRVMHADLFILSLLASVTLGLIWSLLQSGGASWWSNLFFALYVAATTVLFGSVPWSKFAHMFFKPAAAFQKRVAEADGSRSRLPPPADKPEVFGSARRLPQNY